MYEELKNRFERQERAATLLGIQLIELRDGYAKMEIPLCGVFQQSEAVIFGGIIAAFTDYIAPYAVMTRINTNTEVAPTISMTVSFMLPVVLEDNALIGEGRITNEKIDQDEKGRTKRIITVEVDVISKRTKTKKAHYTGTFLVMPRDVMIRRIEKEKQREGG